MKKILFVILAILPLGLIAQQDLKGTKWLLDETGLLVPMSELSIMTFTKCSDLKEIKTEGRSILSFEDFLFASTYHPGTQTENQLCSFRYEFIEGKNQLHIQYDFSRSNYYDYEISDGKLRLILQE